MSYVQRLLSRFAAVLLVALIGSLALSSWFVLSAFERALIPEIEGKSVTLGHSLINLIGQAHAQGMALDELVGVREVLLRVQKSNDEIGLLVITDNSNKVIHQVGSPVSGLAAYYVQASHGHVDGHADGVAPMRVQGGHDDGVAPMRLVSGYYIVTLPIDLDGGRQGYLHIGAKQAFVQGVLKESLLDVLVVLVVAFFIAVEITYFFAGRSAVMQLAMLMRAVAQAGKGNFACRISTPMKQSVGSLATRVEHVATGVNAAYAAMLGAFGLAWRERRSMGHGTGNGTLLDAGKALRALRSRYCFDGGQMDDGAAKIALLRAPLFLAFLGDDLARAFLPLYCAQLFTPLSWLSTKFVLGLPIMLFMLIVALSQPLLGGWSERVGRRQALFVGVAIGVVAHIGAALAYSIYDFLLWWALAGLSWGIVFIAAQGYVLQHATGPARVRGLAFFVGIIMISSVCGPSIGGILADGIGYRPTLFFAGILGCFSAWMIRVRLPEDRAVSASHKRIRMADIASLLRNRRFLVFLLSGAMPAKIILIGFCFYLVPLYMPDIGSSSAMAGRLIMLYAIVMVIGIPLTARWSADQSRRRLFVSAGLIISACAGLFPLLVPGIYGVVGLVLLLGIGQSLSIAPQTAMVAPLCRKEILLLGEGTVLGVYRLIERIGNVFGPLVAAVLLQAFGFGLTFAIIGLFVGLCGVIFFLTSMPAESGSRGKALQ